LPLPTFRANARQCGPAFLHGDDDQIVPIAASAMLSSRIVKGAKLKVYKGGSHGMCVTQKDEVNEDLLAFIKG
jgi:non-heme chloroperoxidase